MLAGAGPATTVSDDVVVDDVVDAGTVVQHVSIRVMVTVAVGLLGISSSLYVKVSAPPKKAPVGE